MLCSRSGRLTLNPSSGPRSAANTAVWLPLIAPPARLRVLLMAENVEQHEREAISSSHASNSTPFRAPVTVARMACGAFLHAFAICGRAAPPKRQSLLDRAGRRRIRPRISVRKDRCGCGWPRRRTPQPMNRASVASLSGLLPGTTADAGRNGRRRSRSMSVSTLPSSRVSHAAPYEQPSSLQRFPSCDPSPHVMRPRTPAGGVEPK